jgi:hypothetical protein
MRNWIQFGVVVVCLTLAVSVGVAWHAARLDAVRLQVELKASQAALLRCLANTCFSDASRRSCRLLASEKQKVAVRTPQEVVETLQDVLPLPTPLVVEPEQTDGKSEKSTDTRLAHPPRQSD